MLIYVYWVWRQAIQRRNRRHLEIDGVSPPPPGLRDWGRAGRQLSGDDRNSFCGTHPQHHCRPIGTSEKKCRMVPCVNIQACWRESCLLSERLPNPLCRAAGSSGGAFHTCNCRRNGRRTTRQRLNGKSPQRIDFENNTSCWPALRVKKASANSIR